MSYLNKLRKLRRHVYTVTDDNIAWVLDSVSNLLHLYDSNRLVYAGGASYNFG
jgi:hypothetical protein